jgi:outer membrane receptor protein involved in Fe transport
MRLVRNPNTGANATLSTTFNNEQQVDLAGWDVQYNWTTDIGPGSLNLSALATITDHTKTRPSPTAQWFDYKGSSGPSNIRSVNSYSYDYRLLTSVGYTMGNWNASVRWRYLPSIESESAVRTLVSLDQPTGDYSIFDGSARYNLTSKSELRFGVDNLFNVDPEITFRETGRYTNAGDTNENFYDFLGRRWYVGFKMSF